MAFCRARDSLPNNQSFNWVDEFGAVPLTVKEFGILYCQALKMED
jgi:hypothetical protein